MAERPPADVASFAMRSYRYLRLSIVVVTMAILASVVIERANAACWQGSISAYFYTPVRSVFVAGMLVIGVCLIVIRGRGVEDVLLNLAGVLAGIVALVPTSPPVGPGETDRCASVMVQAFEAKPFIDNNILAFAIGGAVAIGLAWLFAKLPDGPKVTIPANAPGFGLYAGLAILAVGVIWYYAFRRNFLDHAHGGAAVAMFVVIGIVMVINALRSPLGSKRRVGYAAIAGSMVAAGLVVGVGKLIDPDWHHYVLWLELLELTAFAVYWIVQTLELWTQAVPEDRPVIPPRRPATR